MLIAYTPYNQRDNIAHVYTKSGICYNVYRFKKHGATHDNKTIKMLTLKYYFSEI
jgi:hypothetical protein